MKQIDLQALRRWIGRTQRCVDILTARLVASLQATLSGTVQDTEADAQSIPHCIHWCLAPQIPPASTLAADGHAARGEFLPPAPFSQRMWAGGEVAFYEPFRLGDEVTRLSRVEDVRLKTGGSGALCFVVVRHEFSNPRGPAISERQDIVYREPSAGQVVARQTSEGAPREQWRRQLRCNPVLLFRYSALTFNSHRIHYDADYCRQQEHYPGLLVQGPLQASLLLEFASSIRDHRRPRSFTYRSVAPLFAGPAQLGAAESEDDLELYVSDENGRQTMMARASW